jgi:hypothetical protein
MRSQCVLLLLGISTALATSNAAADPEPSAMNSPGTTRPNPVQPSAAPADPEITTAPQDRPQFVEPPNEERGFVLNFSSTIVVPAGEFSEGVDASSFGAGVGFGALFGVYATEHLGVLGGFSGSVSHQGYSDCKVKDDCKGTRFQLPVVAQYALRNRKEGLYFQGGLGFASTFTIRVDGDGYLTVSSPFDVKLGLGYRVPAGIFGPPRDKPSRSGVDLFAGFDLGQFQHVSASSRRSGELDSDIARPAMHYLLEIGAAFHWTP